MSKTVNRYVKRNKKRIYRNKDFGLPSQGSYQSITVSIRHLARGSWAEGSRRGVKNPIWVI